jgi:tetratricopeptide (TPR) repeat protein
LAQCLTQLALSSARNGLSAESDRNFRRAVELLEQLLSQAPERSADRLHLAQAAHNLGHFLFLARTFKDSERFARIAFKAYEQLFFENHQQEAMIRGCTQTMNIIASTQLETGRFADAANSYREALKLFASMPPKLALEPLMRDEQGKVHDNLGVILIISDSLQDAETQIHKGIKVRESLLALAPNEPRYQDDLGQSKAHLGVILAKRGEAQSARRLFEQAIELGQNALKADPRYQAARHHLRGSRKALAVLLLDQRDYVALGATSEDLLRDYSPDDQSDTLMEAAANLAECAYLAMDDQPLPPDGRKDSALPYARRALEIFQKAAENKKSNAATINLAWFRLTCPIAELCDADEAMRLARDLTKRSPERGSSWSILGAACYYSADLKGAVSAIQKARTLDKQFDGVCDFIAAMANWKLGDKQGARSCFVRAQNWMNTNKTTAQHRRIRSQAAALMGLPDRDK